MVRVTIEDVARDVGVSAMTVSRVLNERSGVGEDTRARVSEAIRRLGYRRNSLARGLKARASYTIGLVVPDITNPYFPEIVRGAEDVALEAGYGVFLSNTVEDREREAASLERMEERRVDGVIVVSPRTPAARLQGLLRNHAAAVVVNGVAPPQVAGSVRLDEADGVRQALDHLQERGRTRLAVLAGPASSFAATERLRAIEALLSERGRVLARDRLVRSAPYVDEGAAAARHLLSAEHGNLRRDARAGDVDRGGAAADHAAHGGAAADRAAQGRADRGGAIDAVLCYNDLVAAGVLQACAELGVRVPEDLAVVGFDDIPFARMFTPSLTTLHAPKYELGAAAMRMLLERIQGLPSPAEVVLPPTLMVRASTPAKQNPRLHQEEPA